MGAPGLIAVPLTVVVALIMGKDTARAGNGMNKLDLCDGAPGDAGDGGNGKDVAESDPGDTLISVP